MSSVVHDAIARAQALASKWREERKGSKEEVKEEATKEWPKTDTLETLKVDWTKIQRQTVRRAFIQGYEALDPAAAAARRAELGVDVECDPAGKDRTPAPVQTFAELNVLPSWVHQALEENKWDKPLPVQAQALPILLSGRNLIGIAQTGSGKTGAFLLPAIVHAHDQEPLKWGAQSGPVVLVLAPTRELAVQISDEAEKLLKYSCESQRHAGGLRSVCFYGGGKKYEQLRKFTYDGSHIVVATPGRLIDFCKDQKVQLARVTYFCLDEADRMLDMGFSGDMDEVGAAIRPERQTVFFSATWPKEVQSLACNMCMDTPVTIRVGRSHNSALLGGSASNDAGLGEAGEGEDEELLLARESITQEVVVVDYPEEGRPWDKQDEEKKRLLDVHIKNVMAMEDCKMIIFVNQKTFATELSDKLWQEGVSVDALHGGRPQETRLRILDAFRKGETRLLIATDVIGRGLDIPKVSHVVVYSMNGVEDYVHRIGRTGRGKDGKGHALVFFEFFPQQPECAKELIGVLQRCNQPVPPKLQQIADDVAAGRRSGKWGGKPGGGGGGWNRWGSGSWDSTSSWKDKGGGGAGGGGGKWNRSEGGGTQGSEGSTLLEKMVARGW